jgi:asparagine N-glycosylation enzyme membrane subunit Stt3
MKKYFLFAVCITATISLNIYFRSFPISLPQSKKYAEETVKRRLHQEAIQQAYTNFPGFGSLAKDNLIKALDNAYRKQKKAEIKKIVQIEYRKLKDNYQDATGQTYLMELDGWHWARYVDNVLRLGRVGDKVSNGKQFDTLMLAPTGSYIPWNHFFFYFSAYLYKIFSLFKHVPLLTFLFYLPLFSITIFTGLFYLFCFYRWGNLVAVISGLFVGLSPVFLTRSSAGWFDMDIFSLLFPLLIIWGYLLSYNAPGLGFRMLYLAIAGFFAGLFSFTWLFWWFIVVIIIMYEFYSLFNMLFEFLQYKKINLPLLKKRVSSLFFFLLFSSFWVILFSGFEPLEILINQIRQGLILNNPLTNVIWPNVYSTVGELRKSDFIGIANSMGGVSLFICSVACLIILFLSVPRNPRYTFFQSESAIIMAFWFITMFLACLKGVRFSMYLTLPLGISLAWVSSELYKYFKNKNNKLAVIFICALMF